MKPEDAFARLNDRDDIDCVLVAGTGTIYGWLNTGLGHTGAFDPGLLGLLQEASESGHGVFIPALAYHEAAEGADFEIRPDWR